MIKLLAIISYFRNSPIPGAVQLSHTFMHYRKRMNKLLLQLVVQIHF